MMVVDTPADTEKDIERLNTLKEITHDMTQVVALEAKLERFQKTMKEHADDLSNDFFGFSFSICSSFLFLCLSESPILWGSLSPFFFFVLINRSILFFLQRVMCLFILYILMGVCLVNVYTSLFILK